MKLFKKKEEKCCCNQVDEKTMKQAVENQHSGARIKVLGSGCAKCNALEKSVQEALNDLNIVEEIEHVTDFLEISSYGVMSTPALVVDGKVVCFGKVLSKDEVISLLTKVGF